MVFFLESIVCGGSEVLKVLKFVLKLMEILLFIVPILLIVFVMADLIFAVIAHNEDNMKKKVNLAIKRTLVCLSLFLIEPVVRVTIGLLGDNGVDFAKCLQIARTESDFSSYGSGLDSTSNFKKKKVDLFPNKNIDIVTDKNDTGDSATVNNSSFLATADKLWKQVANGNFTYSLDGQSIPITGTGLDCSSFVSWVLYEYGYKDFEGAQQSTASFISNANSYKEKYGWKIISVNAYEDVSSVLQPGDILVRDTNAAGGSAGHVNIFVKKEGENIYVYDAGSETGWKNSGGNPIVNNSFAISDPNSGIIIRVNPPKK